MTKSYTTDGLGPLQAIPTALRQFRSLIDQKRRLPVIVTSSIATVQRFERSVAELTGMSLHDLDVLEIGHGQSRLAIAYVAALGNRATGIDLDAVPDGLFDMAGYIRTLRANGLMRAVKTWVRDVSGLNRSLRREFVRQLGLAGWPSYKSLVADAADTGFSDACFDFLYSFHVLEHVADPEGVLREVARLVRPGGGFWFRFPHYAHYNALHDLRWITQAPNPPLPWAHLVESERHTIQQGAFVNTLRIADWRSLFEHHFPGVVFRQENLDGDRFTVALRELRGRGLLQEFTDEELLTDDLVVAWRCP